MKKYHVKVSYLKRFSSSGTCYRKTYNLNSKVYETFLRVLHAEQVLIKDHEKKMYLNTPLETKGNIVFLNLTQAKLLTNWLLRLNDLEINAKRASYDHNTCILINNK